MWRAAIVTSGATATPKPNRKPRNPLPAVGFLSLLGAYFAVVYGLQLYDNNHAHYQACQSGLGQFDQSAIGGISHLCNTVQLHLYAGYGLLAGGVLLGLFGVGAVATVFASTKPRAV